MTQMVTKTEAFLLTVLLDILKKPDGSPVVLSPIGASPRCSTPGCFMEWDEIEYPYILRCQRCGTLTPSGQARIEKMHR